MAAFGDLSGDAVRYIIAETVGGFETLGVPFENKMFVGLVGVEGSGEKQ